MEETVEFGYLADWPAAVPRVADWWFDTWGGRRAGDSAGALAAELRGQLSRTELPVFLVAIDGGEIAGTAAIKEHELKAQYPDLRHWVGNVFVRPSSRGQGIAAGLVKRVERLALGLGITTLHLATERVDGGLYARLGYEILDRTRDRAQEVAVMVRNLDALGPARSSRGTSLSNGGSSAAS